MKEQNSFNKFDIKILGKGMALTLGLALAYFLLAQLGLKLATLSQSASPVWPATGFAISIVYLFGNRALLAVALGAFAANVLLPDPWIAAIFISIGNSLEAFVGAFIIHQIRARVLGTG